MIPFFLIACVIPLIVLRIPVRYSSEMRSFIGTSAGYDDFFHLIKGWVLYAAAVFLFAAFLWKKGPGLPHIFVLFFPYIILNLLSAGLSKTMVTAVFGFADHYEGALTQICYVLILLFAYYLADSSRKMITVIKGVVWAAVAIALIGVLQLAGSPLILSLIPGEVLQFSSDQVRADLSGITSTIGNSNYTGTYSVIVLPLSVFLVLREKTIPRKIVALVLFFGASVFLLLGSLSKAAYISFLVICPLMAVFLWKSLREQLLWVLGAMVFAGCIFFAMNIAMNGILLKEVQSLNSFVSEAGEGDRLVFEDIGLDEDAAIIRTNRWTLTVQNGEEGFLLQDGAGAPIRSELDKSRQAVKLMEYPYENIYVWQQQREEIHWILLEMAGKELEFVHTGQAMKAVGFNSVLTGVERVRAFQGIKNEAFASGRGYIWSRSIPLLKGALVWGYGPDAFAYVFPQNDIVGKLNYGAVWVIITKPHSWYLQVALGSGVLSLLCLLIFFGWYGIKSIRVYLRKVPGENAAVAFAILLSVTGFLVAGVFNDSVVSVSPILWMLCGFGVRLMQNAEAEPALEEQLPTTGSIDIMG